MKLYLVISIFLLKFSVFSQDKLIINQKGELNESSRNKLMLAKKYQAVSAFDTVSRSPLLIYALYFKNNKMGILNIYGKEITPPIYDEIPGLNISHTNVMFGYHDHYPVIINKKYGLITNTGKQLIPVMYNYITYGANKVKEKKGLVQDSLFFLTENKKEFQADLKGKITTQKMEEQLTENNETVMESYNPPTKKETNTNYSKHGKIIRENTSIAIVENKVNGKYLQGAFNKKTNELILPVEYNYIIFDRYNRMIGYKINNCVITDSSGKNLLNEEFNKIEEFNGLYKITRENKTAFFDKNLIPVSDFVYERFGSANGELIVVSKNGKYGLVSIEGKELTQFIFDELQLYSSHSLSKTPFVIATIGEQKGLLSAEGKYLTGIEYQDIYPESSINDHGGYSGDVMPEMYNYDPSNAYFIFKRNNKFGIMNNNFQIIVADTYDQVKKSDHKDFVYVAQNGNPTNWGILNISKNQLITPIEFNENFKYGYHGYFVVGKNRSYGVCNNNGKIIVPVQEEATLYIDYIYKGLIKVYNRKKIFYIDPYDNVVSLLRANN